MEKYYAGGEHFASGVDGLNRAPGVFFAYANLNYGVIGTIFERLSGERFDVFMKKHVLESLGLAASFNVRRQQLLHQGILLMWIMLVMLIGCILESYVNPILISDLIKIF